MRRWRTNNKRQVRYRARQPSEVRRQENAEFKQYHLAISPKLVCDKEFTSVEYLFAKSLSFDGFELVQDNKPVKDKWTKIHTAY